MGFQEALRIHLAALEAGRSDFEDSLALVERFFDFTPTAFDNGALHNNASENGGSGRIFALGQLASLSEQATLTCFGRHYQTVMDDPAGSSHANIRQFMRTGWSGVRFEGRPLMLKTSYYNDPESRMPPTQTNNGETR